MQTRRVVGSAVLGNAVELHGGRHCARHYLEMVVVMLRRRGEYGGRP